MRYSLSHILSKIFDGSIIKFKDRQTASEMLISIYKHKFQRIPSKEVLILAIPRGGIIIGEKIAMKYGYKLDIIIPRRLLAPHNSELSIGAIMKDNSIFLDHPLIKKLNITDEYLNIQKSLALSEIKRRENILGKQVEEKDIKGKYIILVDDGAATGASLIVTSRWIKNLCPRSLIILIPICPNHVVKVLKQEADHIESIIKPSSTNFSSVEMYYENFSEIEFNELENILKKYK